jgi:hypothetical protein
MSFEFFVREKLIKLLGNSFEKMLTFFFFFWQGKIRVRWLSNGACAFFSQKIFISHQLILNTIKKNDNALPNKSKTIACMSNATDHLIFGWNGFSFTLLWGPFHSLWRKKHFLKILIVISSNNKCWGDKI